jgi:hypothetical protein
VILHGADCCNADVLPRMLRLPGLTDGCSVFTPYRRRVSADAEPGCHPTDERV